MCAERRLACCNHMSRLALNSTSVAPCSNTAIWPTPAFWGAATPAMLILAVALRWNAVTEAVRSLGAPACTSPRSLQPGIGQSRGLP